MGNELKTVSAWVSECHEAIERAACNKLAWVNKTPLGVPVVPDVYINKAG